MTGEICAAAPARPDGHAPGGYHAWMQSQAKTVSAYLAELPPDRRAALEAVRRVILANIDPAFEERMGYGMIGYAVPHSIYPAGYHCDPKQPLPFMGLASQKNHMSVYLMSLYGESSDEKWFRAAWAKTGKKLDMGKCCIRFRKLDDLALDVIAEAVRRVPVQTYIERYEAARAEALAAGPRRASRAAKSGATKRTARKSTERTKSAARKPARRSAARR